MTSTIDRTAKRRVRRIASDEAHAWARNLHLYNPNAKLLLMMLSGYIDGDGFCFVSIPSLAKDTDLSQQTVRSRLTWLEQIGAIARLPQWIDEYGRRNGAAQGRRTSDLIQLMIDRDDEIEAAVSGESDAVSREADPMPQTGSDRTPETADPALTLRRPYDSVEGLISEPEPESPPKAPSGGESEPASLGQGEPEHFGPAWSAWPGHEVMRRDLALAEFRQLPPDKQALCRAAVPLFAQQLIKLGRKHPPNFHLWIRNRGFEEFPGARLDGGQAGGGGSFDATSAEGRAIAALYGVARVRAFESAGRIVYARPMTPQLLAFADAGPPSSWGWIEDRQQIAAWSAFVAEHVLGSRPVMTITRGVGDAQRAGIEAPWPWPPRKDGRISETQASQEGAE